MEGMFKWCTPFRRTISWPICMYIRNHISGFSESANEKQLTIRNRSLKHALWDSLITFIKIHDFFFIFQGGGTCLIKMDFLNDTDVLQSGPIHILNVDTLLLIFYFLSLYDKLMAMRWDAFMYYSKWKGTVSDKKNLQISLDIKKTPFNHNIYHFSQKIASFWQKYGFS